MSNPLVPALQTKIILDNLMNGVYFVDKERRITYWNKAAEQISGYKSEDVLGKTCKEDILAHSRDGDILCGANCPLIEAIDDISTAIEPVSLRHKDGYRVPVRIRCVPLKGEDDSVVGAVEVFERIYEQEDVILRLKELGQYAYLDALTGIPNRRYLEDSLTQWLHAYHQTDRNFVVVMADIDFFKNVNDRYGHDAGDLVLKNVAETLRTHLRSMDVVGRWGGEEFLILFYGIRVEKLENKFESLRQAVEDCAVSYGASSIKVTMSFGCTSPRVDDTPTKLVARADEYLYKSKREGRNRVSIDIGG